MCDFWPNTQIVTVDALKFDETQEQLRKRMNSMNRPNGIDPDLSDKESDVFAVFVSKVIDTLQRVHGRPLSKMEKYEYLTSKEKIDTVIQKHETGDIELNKAIKSLLIMDTRYFEQITAGSVAYLLKLINNEEEDNNGSGTGHFHA
ncbi:hypothetical protein [Vibrio coralliilyticus]|uniref:Uncharacterized protein n=2 Tax=Vibrionaceae TaxID=641 RepID=A0A2S3R1S2_VIBVL|nr:hypothetical protein [Vibrio coralliilyticus]PAW02311.1 hypothetical protein CKJ79_16755 [Vibrio coralliilyticus]POB47042.1 hypothetical protein CRN52_13270 [Vibrio vulnificus]